MTFRRLAPTAAPLGPADLWHGVAGMAQTVRAKTQLAGELASFLNVKHVFLMSSGRASLAVALRALGTMSSRRSVIVPAYTCYSVAAAVAREGLAITLCDVEPETLDFNHGQLERLVKSEPPLAVVTSHLCGKAADIGRVRQLCRAHEVAVIDDAAQALGVDGGHGLLGTIGDAGIFSFGRGKAVTSVKGGAVVTNSDVLAQAIAAQHARLPDQTAAANVRVLVEALALLVFLQPWLYWVTNSMPFLRLGETTYSPTFPIESMSGLEAGLLSRWRMRLEQSNETRGHHARMLALAIGVPLSHDVPYLKLPVLCASRAERDRLVARSHAHGLGLGVMYPAGLHSIPFVSALNHGVQYPGADRLADCLLTIPVHPLMSDEDGRRIDVLLKGAALAGGPDG